MNTQLAILLQNSIQYLTNGKPKEAELLLNRILELESNNSDALRILGILAALENNWSRALQLTNEAVLAKPEDFQGYVNRANIFQAMHMFDKSLDDCERAISLCPSSPEAHNNLGNALQSLNRCQDAIESYETALQFNNQLPQALKNKGNAHKALKQFNPAIECYLKSIELDPNYASAFWSLSLTELLLGRYEAGLKNYEYRWLRENADPYLYPNLPRLESLRLIENQQILVWAEQGYGDTLQFARYVPLLMRLGAKVTLQIQAPIVSLFRDSFNCTVISLNDTPDNVSDQIPLGSLPLLFNTSLENMPANSPYITVNPNKISQWKSLLNLECNKLNIGIACSGNIKFDLENGNTRPAPLALFAEFSEIANLFLIQKEVRPSDKEFLSTFPKIRYLGCDIKNFEDTAAIIENMDQIITIDTSLAHLAGALGKKTYVLLPWVPDWRWQLDQDNSPWYPSARLFRQVKMGDWQEVFSRIKLSLQDRS